jgi:phosphopantothenoylcysteine decarboxylase/phosphopantothenate--cysteine ligase
MRGASVTLILGPGSVSPPDYLNTIPIRDFHDYHSKVHDTLAHEAFDIGIFSAAVADYIPNKVFDGKIPSQGSLKSIPLTQTPKVIDEVRQKHRKLYMVIFKYEDKISRDNLLEIAKKRATQGYELVVANRGEDMTSEGDYQGIIVDKNGKVAEASSKEGAAIRLLDLLEDRI